MDYCTNKAKIPKFLFWNFRSIQARKFELEKVSLDFDIIVGVETWLNKYSLISFTAGHNIHRPNAAGGSIKVLISKKNRKFLHGSNNAILNELCQKYEIVS